MYGVFYCELLRNEISIERIVEGMIFSKYRLLYINHRDNFYC